MSCHKLILCAASPVFEAMLYSKFLEGSDYSLDASNSVKITDVSYEAFELFLNYLYTGELDDGSSVDRLMELSYCAQKYLIEDMRKQCSKKLGEYLNRDTILMFLGKSFELHLEDFVVSCLYFIADALEKKTESFANLILNNEEAHLTPRCFEFLTKNLLDYFGERDDVLCLIKSWSLMECQAQGLNFYNESQAVTLKKLKVDESTSDKVLQMKSAFVDSTLKIPRCFHRVYYKPVRPFIIEKNQLSFDAVITFKRFAVIKSLLVNSRYVDQFDNRESYTENINVEVIEKSQGKSLYKQQFTIENVCFNAFFRINFDDTLLLFPRHVYIVKFTWNIEAIGFEYPRCIFSLLEKGDETKLDSHKNPLSIVQFHELPFSPGSIVHGISYDLIS